MTQPLLKNKIQISYGAFGIPKARFSYKKGVLANPDECGEDSFCIADTEKRLVLGVADGVSGSKEYGGNPAAFSRLLMYRSGEIAKQDPKKFKAHQVLKEVYKKIHAEKHEKLAKGASSLPAYFQSARRTGGFLILSPNQEGTYKVVFRSEYQLYKFNFPYQFCLYSDGEGDFESLKKIGKNTQKLILKPGDVVLLMTDGVFDNLYDAELEKITNLCMKNSKSAQKLAEVVGFNAKKRSHDPYANTPFTDGSQECDEEFYGGKEDDITAVVAIISSASCAELSEL